MSASQASLPRGSSPLTRGARTFPRSNLPPSGIIPAHAGSTDVPAVVPIAERDHPRSRGEHTVQDIFLEKYAGSSPLTRGARVSHENEVDGRRIIPAHAGSTLSSFGTNLISTDHPRSRGEHLPFGQDLDRATGSSPLTRGARKEDCKRHDKRRIIPAHAGSTRRCQLLM